MIVAFFILPDWRYIVLAALIATLAREWFVLGWAGDVTERPDRSHKAERAQRLEAQPVGRGSSGRSLTSLGSGETWGQDWALSTESLFSVRRFSADSSHNDLIAQQIDADEEGATVGPLQAELTASSTVRAPYDWQAGGGWAA